MRRRGAEATGAQEGSEGHRCTGGERRPQVRRRGAEATGVCVRGAEATGVCVRGTEVTGVCV